MATRYLFCTQPSDLAAKLVETLRQRYSQLLAHLGTRLGRGWRTAYHPNATAAGGCRALFMSPPPSRVQEARPAAVISAISASVQPTSRRIWALCSPRRGGGRRKLLPGEPENATGIAIVSIFPSEG